MANDPGALLVALVGTGRTVLQLGCGDGSVARDLVDNGCLVSAVDAQASDDTARLLEELVVADPGTAALTSSFKQGSFEVVVASVAVPPAVLREASTLLAEGGRLLVTARNAAHGTRRLALLQGRPGELGDDLVTSDQLCDVLEDTGFTVHELHSTVRDPLDTFAGPDAARLPSDVVEWVRYQPGALDDTYVAVARPADPDDLFASRPEVSPAVTADEVRADDEHTDWVRRDREERHRMLTVRDHILGLEAGLSSADARVLRARIRARAANVRARRARAELDALIEEIESIARTRGSRTDLRNLVARLRERPDDRGEPL